METGIDNVDAEIGVACEGCGCRATWAMVTTRLVQTREMTSETVMEQPFLLDEAGSVTNESLGDYEIIEDETTEDDLIDSEETVEETHYYCDDCGVSND